MREQGSVTAETAVVLPSVVMVLAVVLAVAGGVTARLSCVDAARAGARVAARGEGDARVVAVAREVAPQAQVRIARSGSRVEVGVRRIVSLPLPWLRRASVGALAVADREQAP